MLVESVEKNQVVSKHVPLNLEVIDVSFERRLQKQIELVREEIKEMVDIEMRKVMEKSRREEYILSRVEGKLTILEENMKKNLLDINELIREVGSMKTEETMLKIMDDEEEELMIPKYKREKANRKEGNG